MQCLLSQACSPALGRRITLSLRPTWDTQQVSSHPCLNDNYLIYKKKSIDYKLRSRRWCSKCREKAVSVFELRTYSFPTVMLFCFFLHIKFKWVQASLSKFALQHIGMKVMTFTMLPSHGEEPQLSQPSNPYMRSICADFAIHDVYTKPSHIWTMPPELWKNVSPLFNLFYFTWLDFFQFWSNQLKLL